MFRLLSFCPAGFRKGGQRIRTDGSRNSPAP
ncbi:rCG59943 [Rattus norvegicus]|uniref:RCG59943 n=1 Tax=Rattus norvegicus TaxID=10116 RepID=A6HQQ4_RAT|nr:rCG59943 [Rattus norvegicus]